MEEKVNEIEKVEGEVINSAAVQEPATMEFRLINPTEDGFLRVIKWNKEELEAAVRQKIADYENVVYTEENMQQAKNDRAELNKLIKDIEDRRKDVKKKINEPYDTFEKELKEVLALIQKPVGMIDKQIKEFEDRQKEEKKASIKETYDEVIGDLAEVLPFEKVFDSRYLNKTYKLGTAQAEVREKIQKVRTDLETIDSLDSKYKLNAKDVYIKTLDLSKALAENRRLLDFEEKLEAENKRKAEEERKRREEEEERRREAEERARAEEEQRRQQEAEKKEWEEPAVDQTDVTESSENVIGTPENVSEPQENVSETAQSVSKSQENVPETSETVSEPQSEIGKAINSIERQAFEQAVAPENEKQYKASFTIYGTKDQIMSVKQFMIDNNIRFGKVEK